MKAKNYIKLGAVLIIASFVMLYLRTGEYSPNSLLNDYKDYWDNIIKTFDLLGHGGGYIIFIILIGGWNYTLIHLVFIGLMINWIKK